MFKGLFKIKSNAAKANEAKANAAKANETKAGTGQGINPGTGQDKKQNIGQDKKQDLKQNTMTNEDDIIRKHMKFYGQVQGVGFRYSSRYCALELGVTGWVRNEWDGSVEMEAQGPERQIQRLVQMLNSGKFISIERIEEEIIPPVEGERKFSVL